MGWCLFFKKWFLLVLILAVTGVDLWSIPAIDSLKNEAYNLISEGKEAEIINAYAQAEKKYFKSIEIWNQISEYDEYRAYPYYSLALLYRKMGNYQKSLENYNFAEKILLNSREEYKFLLSAIYSSIGDYFVDIGDYTKAMKYFESAIKVIEYSKERNESVFCGIQINIAQTFYYQHKYQKAIDVCNNYINSKNSIDHNRFEWIIGSSFIALGKYDEAKKILEKSLTGLNDQPERYTEAFLITTKAYIRAGELVIAEKYLNKAIPLLATNKAQNDPWHIYYYELKSEFLKRKAAKEMQIKTRLNILNEAVKVIDKALLMNSITSEANKIPYLETKGEFITPTQVKDLLINRAEVLYSIAEEYRQIGDKISARQFDLLSLKTWEGTVNFIHDFKISFLEEESKLNLSEQQIVVYTQGFDLAEKLYNETGKDEFFEKMLFFSESGKSSTFLASLNAAQAKNFGGIPDSLLDKEKQLNVQLSAMNQMIFNARNSEHPDSALLKEWGKNQFNLQKQYDDLLFKFENDYPNYYKFKYNNQLVSPHEIISKLNPKQALLEYVVDEPTSEKDSGRITILYFTNSSHRVYSRNIGYDYIISLKTILGQLSNRDVGETNLNDFKQFFKSSNYLYSVLIAPIEFKNSITDLIVIPDGKLAYLSFDALIREVPDSSSMSFSKLDYLVQRFNFVYSYSATLHYEYFRNKNNSNYKILAFAPEYSGNEVDVNKAAYRTRQVSRASLSQLPGAKEEVMALSNHYKCKAYIGSQATEEAFKKEAGNYGILHLAMHTMMNDSIPMYSKLIFTSSTDSINDGFLNTQEIYNMKLNAKIAVLSACNTGSGKMQTGEGVMSMARAFLYAGCPSILMTLWEVEDKSSAQLVLDFYRNLFKGYSKPEALRLSKLNYLRNADPLKSHPYFWMGYIIVGDPTPIRYHTSTIILMVIFVFIGIVIILFRKKIATILGLNCPLKFKRNKNNI